jgi:hypothetical protein
MELLFTDQTEKQVSIDLLKYRAPFLIEKLLKDAVIESLEEGERLFTEVKRWMFLVSLERTKSWEIYSYRVDEVWHQFILFTSEYMKFCDHYFGTYFSHYPSNAPVDYSGDEKLSGTFDEFEQLYLKTFKTELPDIWFDERNITTKRRILNNNPGELFVKEEDQLVKLMIGDENVLMTINLLAKEAITFIATTKAFYVRELPGDLTDDEKTLIISSLVGAHLLRVAP